MRISTLANGLGCLMIGGLALCLEDGAAEARETRTDRAVIGAIDDLVRVLPDLRERRDMHRVEHAVKDLMKVLENPRPPRGLMGGMSYIVHSDHGMYRRDAVSSRRDDASGARRGFSGGLEFARFCDTGARSDRGAGADRGGAGKGMRPGMGDKFTGREGMGRAGPALKDVGGRQRKDPGAKTGKMRMPGSEAKAPLDPAFDMRRGGGKMAGRGDGASGGKGSGRAMPGGDRSGGRSADKTASKFTPGGRTGGKTTAGGRTGTGGKRGGEFGRGVRDAGVNIAVNVNVRAGGAAIKTSRGPSGGGKTGDMAGRGKSGATAMKAGGPSTGGFASKTTGRSGKAGFGGGVLSSKSRDMSPVGGKLAKRSSVGAGSAKSFTMPDGRVLRVSDDTGIFNRAGVNKGGPSAAKGGMSSAKGDVPGWGAQAHDRRRQGRTGFPQERHGHGREGRPLRRRQDVRKVGRAGAGRHGRRAPMKASAPSFAGKGMTGARAAGRSAGPRNLMAGAGVGGRNMGAPVSFSKGRARR